MTIRNVMSIDVEEWFHPEALRPYSPIDSWPSHPSHLERQMGPLIDLLAEHDTKATFFVLGQVARRNPALVRRLAEAGHEIASHGDGHEMITDLTPQALREDLTTAKQALEDATGQAVLGYRAPTFSIVDRTLWALDVIAETGHRYDASIYPIHHDRYGIPTAPRFAHPLENGLIELPGSTVRVLGSNVPIGGGGYLRLLPLLFNLVGLTYLNSVEKQPFVVYFHPWETDPHQPRLEVPLPRKLRHYGNISRMLDRIRKLLEGFRFTTAQDLLTAEGLLPRADGASR